MKKIMYILILIMITATLSLMSYKPIEKEHITLQSFMCQDTNCEKIMIQLIQQSKESLYCAFFDFDLQELHHIIEKQPIKKLIYVDGDNNHFESDFIRYQNKSSYMHHKFCIFDERVTLTGSFNPTINGRDKNDNNILIIESKEIAKIYRSQFSAIITNNKTTTKHKAEETQIKTCFTPKQDCLSLIRNEIKNANHSIKAMLFTMTDTSITNLLLQKKLEGINTTLLFEKSLITKYSSFHKLLFHNISVCKDSSSGKLHHKVFIIDDKTVITGSMNPSTNAQKRNDENVIIIDNKRIAENYLNEFFRLEVLCMT